MTDAELQAVRERCNLATKGPWSVTGVVQRLEVSCPGGGVVADTNPAVNAAHNATFTAHAREDVPALLAEVDRLRAALAHIRKVVDDPQTGFLAEIGRTARNALEG